ncbi:Peptidyl-tRNA hydrolase ArfB [Thalassoglobus neptunius]|uniref:Peptidyl-tRNA hydrolase ArfB n=1 Tax=Thalassoglobus neptunius TaxID=1938619 RepID=A0A5C5X4I3_9PLAN|nr:alternative ribosome rescue aminoacyl-tRNA hydrolase ArfB [Thalassoglobus neptunius]TWT57906.1 Peptidyl-tRNA hydrolase ArfB [Thalassoglobus neptunius]
MSELFITPRISIPLAEIEFRYARSSGPGGQNVNKVNSQAQLFWNAKANETLPPDVLKRLLIRERNRITEEGVLRINSQQFRDQERNRRDCLNRLRQMVVEALAPAKKRKPTRLPRWAKEKRLREKKRRSDRKQSRRPPKED